MPNDTPDMLPVTQEIEDIRRRLLAKAQAASETARWLAEQKSLRQTDNTEGRKDLYSWPTPSETIEGRAAALIATLGIEQGKAESVVPVGDLENVAQAIHAAQMAGKGPLGAWTWDEAAKDYYRNLARAAIAALSPPAEREAGEPVAFLYLHPTTGEKDFSFSRDTARAERCRECNWTEVPLYARAASEPEPRND